MFVFTRLPSSPPQLDSLSISVVQLMCNNILLRLHHTHQIYFISFFNRDSVYVLPGGLLEILIT